MGGNALQHTHTRRYQRAEYEALCELVLSTTAQSAAGGPTRFEVIPCYANKESFGDMDVLVCWDGVDGVDGTARKAWIRDTFATEEVVINGGVHSFGFHELQIDFIVTPPDEFDFALCYFSFNDLGALLGRVFRHMGARFGQKGLGWALEQHGKSAWVLVTLDFDLALSLAGYDPDRFHQGFATLEDVFSFVLSSPHFHPSIFHPSVAGAQRMHKRNTQSRFLQWLDEQESPPQGELRSRDEWLADFSSKAPGFAERYAGAKSELQQQEDEERALKEKMAGGMVAAWTGRKGADLGALMKRLASERGGQSGLRAFVLASSPEVVQKWVLDVHAAME